MFFYDVSIIQSSIHNEHRLFILRELHEGQDAQLSFSQERWLL